MSAYQARLGDLLDGFFQLDGGDNPLVRDISADSRELSPGSVFVALKGGRVDARHFVSTALENGVVAVLVDPADGPLPDPSLLETGRVHVITDLRMAMSEIAARLYQHPSKRMKVIGITGTNGKTTIAWILAQLLQTLGLKSGLIGTLGAGLPDALDHTGLTTPDAISLQKQLAAMRDQGVEVVCLEVSSHALELGRVAAIRFEGVVFSNLSQDHLDFHGSMQAYAEAKQRLFKEYPYRFAVLNADDELGRRIAAEPGLQALTYGIDGGALRARRIRMLSQGLRFEVFLETHQSIVQTTLIGLFNVYNLLAVCGVAVAMGYSLEDVSRALKRCRAVPGRMERIDSLPGHPVVVVDYAHTPDALEKALAACRGHCAGSLLVVFGCGGDRDRNKRPRMGAIAERDADLVVLTDDNPRRESPAQIVAEITAGMSGQAWVLHQREEAVEAAIRQAHADDWVLIAGKGHESGQVCADRVIEMDDRLLARQTLERLAA